MDHIGVVLLRDTRQNPVSARTRARSRSSTRRAATSNWGQFMCMPGPWVLLNHLRSSCGLAVVTVRSSSLYTAA